MATRTSPGATAPAPRRQPAARQAAGPAGGKTVREPARQAASEAAPKAARKSAAPKPPAASAWKRVARPDAIDFRDRPYRPGVTSAPPLQVFPPDPLPVEHQGSSNACTGFALAVVVNRLLRRSGREPDARVSPYMLYSMARRYDEFPGSVEDAGSSARGALKGWFRHGVCRQPLFADLAMPPATPDPADDWWLDAVQRPLGAYYRIDPQDLPDMHAALAETGALFVTSGCHAGWDDLNLPPGRPLPPPPAGFDDIPVIRRQPGMAAHEGHAYALVGYNAQGFLIQNSWGERWGCRGLAVLPYEDWLEHGWDCWVAQLGVVTASHQALAQSSSLRLSAGRGGRLAVQLAADEVLRDREISPFVLNMGNNGDLSNSGRFRTQPADVQALIEQQLPAARQAWGLAEEDPLDVCFYAHGGLVGEGSAAETAARWIPRLYEQRVLPVFLMWETDFLSTLGNRIEDALKGQERSAARGLGEKFERFWNTRLERLLARPGTGIWGEMKQNADALSLIRHDARGKERPLLEQPGIVQLWRHFGAAVRKQPLRLHLVGHSAGSIVTSLMADRLITAGLRVESVSFMAPAVRADTFERHLLPHLKSGQVARFQTFHMDETTEEADSVGPYRRSLLYLLRESFEGGSTVPITGLAIDWDTRLAPALKGARAAVQVHTSPGRHSRSLSHGGFDEDEPTLQQVLAFIRGR